MDFPFTADQVVIGLVGLGMVAKRLLDIKVSKTTAQSTACAMDHDTIKNYHALEFERINMKLDVLINRSK